MSEEEEDGVRALVGLAGGGLLSTGEGLLLEGVSGLTVLTGTDLRDIGGGDVLRGGDALRGGDVSSSLDVEAIPYSSSSLYTEGVRAI